MKRRIDKKNRRSLDVFAMQKRGMTSLGRSMVEMLGVLAIIGILSVGALAGFNKAMEKHKRNQFFNNFSQAWMNLSSALYGKTDVDTFTTSMAIKMGIFPKNMIQKNKVLDAWKNEIEVRYNSPTVQKIIGIVVSLKGENRVELCVEYINFFIDAANTDYMYFHNSTQTFAWKTVCGDYCSKRDPKAESLTMDEKLDICERTCRDQVCGVAMHQTGDWVKD